MITLHCHSYEAVLFCFVTCSNCKSHRWERVSDPNLTNLLDLKNLTLHQGATKSHILYRDLEIPLTFGNKHPGERDAYNISLGRRRRTKITKIKAAISQINFYENVKTLGRFFIFASWQLWAHFFALNPSQ